jgi:alpha-mannosidase
MGASVEGIVVPHTHWDREWYLSFEEFRHWLVEALDKVLIEFERDPQFKFMLDGQVLLFLEHLPQRTSSTNPFKKGTPR